MTNRALYPYLTFAGSLPFVFGTIFVASGVQTLPILGNVQLALSAYGLIIACFMAGAHWGQHLNLSAPWAHILPIASNAVALIMWLAFLTLGFSQFLLALIAGFGFLLALDMRLLKA